MVLFGAFTAFCLLNPMECAAGGILHWTDSRLLYTDSQGRTKELAASPRGSGSGTLYIGSDDPLLSPDGLMAAFVSSDYNLWIVPTDKSGPAKKVTTEGRPSEAERGGVTIFLSGWSPDSKRLLYHLSHSSHGDLDVLRKKGLLSPEIPFGFHVYDLDSGSRTHIPELKEVLFWAPDSQGLIAEKGESGDIVYYRMDITSRTLSEFTRHASRDLGQRVLSRDGLLMAFYTADLDKTTQIGIFKLKQNKFKRISPKGSFGAFQRPSFSPDGRWLGYLHYMTPGNRSGQEWVFRDLRSWFGRSIRVKVNARWRGKFTWLNENLVGISGVDGNVIAFDLKSRRIREFGATVGAP